MTNLAEYALGADPLQPTPPIVGGADATGLWLRFTRPKALPDVEYVAEASTDLTSWSPLALEVVDDGPVQTVRAVDRTAPEASRKFLQLRFVRPATDPG